MRRLVPLAALLAASCASRGFDRGALTRAARVEHQEVTDAEIARVLALRPQLVFPFRLAVWFRAPPAERWGGPRFHWRDEDREAVLAALRPLVGEGTIRELVTIPESTLASDDLRGARLAAARHAADAVLIVGGASALERHTTAASALYVTLVGLWLAPGTRADGVFLATGSLWDVRNEFLYASAEAEGTFGRTRPALLLDDDEVVARAKESALTALATELGARVRALREAPPTAAAKP